MTILQVLQKNNNVLILNDCFRIYMSYNNFIVNTDGSIYLNIIGNGNYKTVLQKTKTAIDNMPYNIPDFLRSNWTFQQTLSEDEVTQFNKFLNLIYETLQYNTHS